MAALSTRDIDEGWEIDSPDPTFSLTSVRLTEVPARLDPPTGRPLPGLPPPPDPQAVLAARVLREAAPGSAEARLAALVFARIPRRVPVPPAWTRRHRRLATPASNRVVLASLHRFGAVCHIGPPAAKPTHAQHSAAIATPRGRRLGTPVPLESDEVTAERRSFWRRLFVSARKR